MIHPRRSPSSPDFEGFSTKLGDGKKLTFYPSRKRFFIASLIDIGYNLIQHPLTILPSGSTHS